MLRASVRPDFDALVRAKKKFQAHADRRLLDESDRAAREARNEIDAAMVAAGLGRMGKALGATSDKKLGKGVHRSGGQTTASGIVFVRSGSQRSRGAIDAYTSGAEIVAKKGPYMWVPGDDIPARSGRYRLTPALWKKNGFDQKYGPLVRVNLPNGTPALIVRNVGISASGKARSVKSLTKRGKPRKGQVQVDYLIAFIGIKRTSRAARVNPKAIASHAAMQMGRRLKRD